ncbi:hypothetical protein [Paraburkholderia sp. J67]|uniref:hypothetical protein n=1 Tax=Paraburkholderia sp. J67 TaxID=2805435 RepID=UPI002ABEA06D|nr:hypothetical protein [Paraburkholderia sp. J67]
MKHSIPLIALAATAMLTGSVASAATPNATASPALAASSSSGSGLATEDASRAQEQQLLGLPRVPKDTNLSAPADEASATTTRVSLRRPSAARVASSKTRFEAFPNPYPSSIYPAAASHSVYKNPW